MSTQIEQVPAIATVEDAAGPPRRPGGGPVVTEGGGFVFNAFSQSFLVLWAIMIIFPIGWVVLGGFKDNTEIATSAWSWPAEFRWDNFVRAWTKAGIGEYLLNTVIVLVPSVLLTMLFGAMAAYVLARYEFPGNRALYYMFLAGTMFPVYLALVPLFFVVKNLGMLNTFQGLVLVYIAYSLPFTVFFMHAFFRTLPTAIAEAGFIDGCDHMGLFFRVMLPMAKPGLISVGIFNVLGQWNQFLLPITLMQPQGPGDPQRYVLAQGLADLAVSQGYAADWPALFAGMTIAMVPVLVVYLSFQRQVQAGLTAGTLK
jgi:N-acetylglucosamine transport system permease protein